MKIYDHITLPILVLTNFQINYTLICRSKGEGIKTDNTYLDICRYPSKNTPTPKLRKPIYGSVC